MFFYYICEFTVVFMTKMFTDWKRVEKNLHIYAKRFSSAQLKI